MNSKGQIGKIIALFPILFIVFVIMGIFLFLCSGLSIAKVSSNGNSPIFYNYVITNDDLMTKSIILDIDGQQKTMLFLEALRSYGLLEINDKRYEAFDLASEKLLTSENNCMQIFLYVLPDLTLPKKIIEHPTGFNLYNAENSARKKLSFVSNDGKNVEADYYYGACPK